MALVSAFSIYSMYNVSFYFNVFVWFLFLRSGTLMNFAVRLKGDFEASMRDIYLRF